jgi:hypothetical protein
MLEDPRVIRVLAYQRSSLLAAGGTFGPTPLASRGDPDRRLTAWVPPCSRSVQGNGARIAPRFPRPPPAEGPRGFRQCRSGPTRAAWRKEEGRTADHRDVLFEAEGEIVGPGGRGEGAASSPGALDFVAKGRIAWSGIGERDSGVGGKPCVCQPRWRCSGLSAFRPSR